ncbi:DUF4272 domain-containing protein [Aureispira anguillae]|uniref:DUF4272 domain-containing protein n=1 Tax=Aureispira anguillae TaxID=2864201 RepID=A0A915YFM4_9BACT|nr:DUF4272 domain-containing protein [Aureispira anguillae]BDS12233.1 DUF4272 domain-containing protein [Aureispira anguillae]
MENCTIYSHYLDFESIETIIRQQLPKAIIKRQDNYNHKSLLIQSKKGFLGRKYTLTVNCRERITPSHQLESISCPLTQNIMGMRNYIGQLPAQDKSIQALLMQKIATINSEISFAAEPYLSEDFEKILKSSLEQLDGILFTSPTSLFKKSKHQHFLDKDFNLILDLVGNSEVNDLEIVVEAKYHDQTKAQDTAAQMDRKSRSEQILQQQQIKINTNLPCSPADEQVSIRSQAEILNRIYALTAVTAKAEGAPSDQIQQLITNKNITHFSPYEQHALAQELSEKETSILTWRYESLFLLFWMVNKVDELPHPSEMCKVETFLNPIFQLSRAAFEADIKLRTKKEVLDLLDLTYRMNWACTDANLKKETPPGNLHPGIVYERHYTLNWLTHYKNQSWDDIRTDT